jgi:hypothetical protein
MTMPRLAQHALALALAGLVALSPWSGAFAAPGAQATPTPTATPACPPGEFFDPLMNRCRLLRQPCPEGTIDLQANGVDDGGDDCQPLDALTAPTGCAPLTGNPLNTPAGQVACALPWQVNGAPVVVDAAVGCVDVDRRPYPRTLVHLTDDTTLRLVGLIPPEGLGLGFGAPGWYRMTGAWRVQGLYLHERFGDTAAFNTRRLLGNDPYPFPSIDRVTAYLELIAEPEHTVWEVRGAPAGVRLVERLGERSRLRFSRASFPLPGAAESFSWDGPDRHGHNTLPAYRVSVRTRWLARLVIGYAVFGVVDNRYEVIGYAGPFAIPVGHYLSRRAWDWGQSPASPGFCDAAQGYLPVPVLEAQAVLRR